MASLKASKREGKGKYAAFDLRKQGRIPAVVYGKDLSENINVSVSLKDFVATLGLGARVIDLDIDGSSRHVLIKAVQHGTYDHQILHADFRAVSETEHIEVEVEIELRGDAPGVAAGGILEQNLYHIAVRCMPKDLPEKVVVDVSGLNLGDVLYLKDLPAMQGVEFMHHGNPSVVSCHHPQAAAEPTAEGEDAATQPEVIGEKEREEKAAEKEK